MKTNQLFHLIPFGAWMYVDLLHIRGNFKKVAQFRAAGDLEAEKEEIYQAQRYWAGSLEKKIGAKIRTDGLENIPAGPALYVGNHQSYCDIGIMILALKRQVGYIAKEELKQLPVFGRWIVATRSVFIKRGDGRESLKAIEEGTAYLKLGFNLAIFPEGTRSKGREPAPFKKGALRPAFKAGVPIVPVTINGSYRLWEEKGYPYPADVTVFIHPPIDVREVKKAEQNAVADEVERIIKEKLAELQG